MKIEEEIKQTKFRSAQHKAALDLIYTANWLEGKQQDFFKPFGITSSQFNILRILRGQHEKGITGAEIKCRMLDRNSDMPRLLDRLLKKKLVSRSPSPNDKRAAEIFISAKGTDVLKLIDAQIDKTEKQQIQLTQKEALQLCDLLDKCRG